MRPTIPRAVTTAHASAGNMPAPVLNPLARAGVTLASLLMAAAMMTAALTATSSARAADAQALYVQGLAATCANCHGTQGKAIRDAVLPGLAGMKPEYLTEQMQAFRSGTRPATIMHQIAKGYTDEQLRLLADYFASQK